MRLTPLLLGLFLLLAGSCDSPDRWLEVEAPDSFKARFVTTKGDFVAEFERELSPAGVDRVYQLIRSGFYSDVAIYRVLPGFVAQFGLNNDSTLNYFWQDHPLPDEPVRASNLEGTISFARGGPETRTTQLFVNLGDNPALDDLSDGAVVGYPVVGRVTEGMDLFVKFNHHYGDQPTVRQDSIFLRGNEYLESNFPGLDYIQRVEILE